MNSGAPGRKWWSSIKAATGPPVFLRANSGALAEGSDDIGHEDVNITSLQPFFAWTAPSATTLALNLETNYDWSTEQWMVPANLRVSQMFTVGDTPIQTSLSGRYNLEGPSGDPEWGVQFTVTLAFPR